MKYKRCLYIFISFFLIILIGYYLGTKVLKEHIYIERIQIFNAKVREINKDYIKIKGLDSNEKDYRNKWFVIPTKSLKLRWKNEKIKLIHLNKGDNVEVSFTGEPTEKYPITINNVKEIKLLEERKTRRLIMLNNILYYDTKNISNEKHINIKEINLKKINQFEIPSSNNTSNFKDTIKYENKNNSLEILIDDKWYIFEPKELRN